eukprot:scaffold88891_cov55-Phaeocystis_antarctica.AAC.2
MGVCLRLHGDLRRVDRVHTYALRTQPRGERDVGRLRGLHAHHAHHQPAHAQLLQVVDPVLGEVPLLVVAEGDDDRVVDGVLPHQCVDGALAVRAAALRQQGRRRFGRGHWLRRAAARPGRFQRRQRLGLERRRLDECVQRSRRCDADRHVEGGLRFRHHVDQQAESHAGRDESFASAHANTSRPARRVRAEGVQLKAGDESTGHRGLVHVQSKLSRLTRCTLTLNRDFSRGCLCRGLYLVPDGKLQLVVAPRLAPIGHAEAALGGSAAQPEAQAEEEGAAAHAAATPEPSAGWRVIGGDADAALNGGQATSHWRDLGPPLKGAAGGDDLAYPHASAAQAHASAHECWHRRRVGEVAAVEHAAVAYHAVVATTARRHHGLRRANLHAHFTK